MKIDKTIGSFCLLTLLLVATKSLAVWPPSVSIDKDAQTSSGAESDKQMCSGSRSDFTLPQRLADDTRRMEEALRDLKEDQKQLNASVHEKPAEPKKDQ